MKGVAALVALAATAATSSAFYLPGVAPTEYMYQEQVCFRLVAMLLSSSPALFFSQLPLHVVKLTSVKRQLPYRYYSLPMCKPDVIVQDGENIGQTLSGARVENSDYKVRSMIPRSTCW